MIETPDYDELFERAAVKPNPEPVVCKPLTPWPTCPPFFSEEEYPTVARIEHDIDTGQIPPASPQPAASPRRKRKVSA